MSLTANENIQIEQKSNLWVFILAGQSNMAGRGEIEPRDTIINQRIFSIDSHEQIVLAKAPLHFYEPSLAGLDCGLSFANALIDNIPDSISILLVPVAIGGSAVSQWLSDDEHRGVKLFSNFVSKVNLARQHGIIKGVLWHQGESDANENDIPLYEERLKQLITKFRHTIGNTELPVLLGELGNFAKYQPGFSQINEKIKRYTKSDTFSALIYTQDLQHKGDSLHFNAAAQRIMGERYAAAFIEKFLPAQDRYSQ